MKHPFLFLKENKSWIAKGLLILFALISAIVYFADFYHTIYVRFRSCAEIHPLLICIGLLSVTFTSCSLVIFLVQFHKHLRGKDYVHLELDGDDNNTIPPDMYEIDSKMMSSRLRNGLKWCSHGFTLFLSVVLVAMMISYSSFESKTLPKINGHLLMPGLISDATIEREPNGVIHIKANNLHDMYFAQGVAMAQERLWEMEFFRRVGSGTLSAVLGNGTLSVDIMFRTLGFWDASEAAVALLSNDSMQVVQAFTDGVNSYLNTKPPLPAEFHLIGFQPAPFVPTDAMLMVKILGFELAGNMFAEVMYHELMNKQNLSFARVCELMPDYSPTGPTILDDEDIAHINFTHQFDPIHFSRTFKNKHAQPDPTFTKSEVPKMDVHDLIRQSGVLKGFNFGFKSASNNWVVSGNKTASGKPLLCNDPHLTINAPSIWLMMHLESPNVSLIGATPVGAPGITIGRNADIAWGVTNTYVDVQDLFVLEMSEDKTSYMHNGSWSKFGVRSETISIKGLPSLNLQVLETMYGPVVSDVVDLQGKTAALRWTQLDDNDTTFEALQQLAVAKNFDDFRNALRNFVGPAQNFIYADTAGNIGYQCPGKIPVRVPGHSGMIPVAGNGSFDWIGWIPYDELPYVLNPSKGYISSANNKIVPPSYPYLLLNNHDWDEHFRAQRIVDLIKARNNHTMQTMMAMQMNTVTGLWSTFKPLIITLPDSLLDDKARVWKYKLLEWDGNETADCQQATVFEYWMYYLGRLGSETGYYSWVFPYFILNTLANNTASECKGDCVKFAASSFVEAVHSANNKKWGDVHHLFIEHPVMSQSPVACLFDRDIKLGGSSFCVNVGAFSGRYLESTANPFDAYIAASYRHIVDLSNMDNSQFVMPMGNSGNLLDANYDNMLDSWINGQYYPMKMSNYPVKHSIKLK